MQSENTTTTGEQRMLPNDFEPTQFDVLCARGKHITQHYGNQVLRSMIEEKLDEYANTIGKPKKSAIVTDIVSSIRRSSPEGGFVRYVDGRWMEVGDCVAREKVGQMFRDCLHTKYKSSTKAKNDRRKKRKHFFDNDDEDPMPDLASGATDTAAVELGNDSHAQYAFNRTEPAGSEELLTTLGNFVSHNNAVADKDPSWGSPPKRRRSFPNAERNVRDNPKDGSDIMYIGTRPLSSKIEGTLWQAMEDVLPPPDPQALYSLCILQLHLIQRLSIESASMDNVQMH